MAIDMDLRKARLCATWALAAAVLAACGGGGDSPSPSPTPPPSSGDPIPPGPPADPGTPPPSDPPSPPQGQPVTIGGSVSGLEGTVRLVCAPGGSISVSASGPFTCPDPVAAGDAYTVSIEALPTKQNCVLTNASGTTTSANVSDVGVTCNTRAWTSGQQVDGDDQPVTILDAGMDREGNVIALYAKGDSPNRRLYAVRGVPGAASQAVQWSLPIRLDSDTIRLQNTIGFSDQNQALAVAPNGDAHAVWASQAPCGLGYREPSSTTCSYLYSSVYIARTNSWSAPVFITDTTTGGGNGGISHKPNPMINDRGDVAVQFGWYNQVFPPKTNTFGDWRAAIAWRAAGEATFRKHAFVDAYGGSFTYNSLVVLDGVGNFVVAGQRPQSNSGNKDIYSYVGSVADGFPATEGALLDTLGNDADLRDLSVGPTGDILLTWDQNDGSGLKIFASSKAGATADWSAPVAFADRTNEGVGFVADNGDAMFYVNCTAYVRKKATGVWEPKNPAIPSGCGHTESAARSSDGSFLTYNTNSGAWNTYDISTNTMAREAGAPLTGSDYLLGFAKGWGTSGKLMYTRKADGTFVGAALLIDNYDTLPTPGAPDGDGRSGIDNLWGFYFK